MVFQLVLDSPSFCRECVRDHYQTVDKVESTAELMCVTQLLAEQRNDIFEVVPVGDLRKNYFWS